MNFLFDTNVISETGRSRPSNGVLNWINQIPDAQQFVSVLTIGEIRYGIERKASDADKQALLLWLDTTALNFFSGRVLPVTGDIADVWARIRVQAKRTLPVIDGLLAATAIRHSLYLATRNTKDFSGIPGLLMINPWDA